LNVAAPVVLTVSAVTAPLLPVLSRMLSVVPAPDVDWSVRVDPVPVPPITKGVVADVLIVAVPIAVVDVLRNVALPLEAIVRAVTAPLLPVLNRMLSVVPAPDVDWSVRVDDAVVPPITTGTVTDVVMVGVAENAGAAPVPVRIVPEAACASA
jgi:hypothetical protein